MEGTRGEERGEGSEEREGEEKRRKRLGGERRTAEGQVEIEPPLSGVLLRVEKGSRHRYIPRFLCFDLACKNSFRMLS